MSYPCIIRRSFSLVVMAGLCLLATVRTGQAIGQARYIQETRTQGSFPIVAAKTAAAVYVDSSDWYGVVRAAGDLQTDIEKVTGVKPAMMHDLKTPVADVIIIGTIGKSAIIDQLIREKKIDVTGVTGQWEAFDLQVVANPLPGVRSALVIAGADKRGTIYGIYDVSEEIGVSPWYFWADVPVNHKDNLFVKVGRYMEGPSAVKYRGIFFNDEAPALDGWVRMKYGSKQVKGTQPTGARDFDFANMNHEFYATVFELVLRMKGNFMWPAMWNQAFNEDDPLNAKTADDYGIVMGTSHHEPMLRAQKEWTRHGVGPWDYSKNADVLKDFWSFGVKRNKDFESLTTIGMRGDGDMPMGGPDLDTNVKLLERIVADQRQILAENVNRDVTKIPQVWALYKEVQAYYEHGMRVPDDVTLLWCDDNWGDIRRLPTPDEQKRAGGAGIYYHFDYVGGPRNYKWIDTNPIPKVWEQMNLALEYGANRLWVVNVGDLKPVEFPTEYFLALGRDPKRWPKEKTGEFTRLWAEREFGAAHATEIADMVSTGLKYNGRRKPELLSDANVFSLTDYQEADRAVADYHTLVAKAEKLQAQLPEAQRPAFFELVLHPAKSYMQVLEMYIDVAKNKLYATQGRASANVYADKVKALFQADKDLGDYYNHTLLDGKWNHMMDQSHIGYTMWQEPRGGNAIPATKTLDLPVEAAMGVALEGSTEVWPGTKDAVLPGFDIFSQEKHYIDIFNKGKTAFDFTATASAPWIVLSATKGKADPEERIWVSVDWAKAPKDTADGTVKIARAGGEDVTVKLHASNPAAVTRANLKGFVESNGYVSIEPEHYAKKTDAGPVHWDKIDDYGRTLSGMSVFPVTAASMTPPKDSPCLEYQMYLFSSGRAEIDAITSPTLNFVPGRGLRLAIGFDDQAPQIVDTIGPIAGRDNLPRDWETIVKDNARHVKATLDVPSPGYHTLKVWMVDPAIVLQKLVVNMGGLKPSYLGPPESYHAAVTK